MSKTFNKPPILIPTEADSRRIVAAAKGDPDAQPLTDKQLKAMAPMREVVRAACRENPP